MTDLLEFFIKRYKKGAPPTGLTETQIILNFLEELQQWRSGEKRYVEACTCKTDGECIPCGKKDCPYGEPLHYDKDGCPACLNAVDVRREK